MYKSHCINPIIVQKWVRCRLSKNDLFFLVFFGIFWFETVMIFF